MASSAEESRACSGVKRVETLEVREEVEHAAEKVWQGYVHEFHTIKWPLVMPGHFDSVTSFEGPPLTVGSVFMVSYHPGWVHKRATEED